MTKQEEIEVAPGFFVERRSVLLGICGFLATAWPNVGRSAALSYEEFLAKANPLAQSLIPDKTRAGQDHYLRSLAAIAANLNDAPVPAQWNETNQGDTPESYQIGFNPGGSPFTVLQWRLEPGARCRPHAHTYGNVLTVGLEGVARVSNYEVVGTADYGSDKTFKVRQTMDQLLRPGSVNLVSLYRNNIHGLVAGPDGARGLDITTRIRPKPEHGTPFLDIGSSPLRRFERIFEASWVYYD